MRSLEGSVPREASASGGGTSAASDVSAGCGVALSRSSWQRSHSTWAVWPSGSVSLSNCVFKLLCVCALLHSVPRAAVLPQRESALLQLWRPEVWDQGWGTLAPAGGSEGESVSCLSPSLRSRPAILGLQTDRPSPGSQHHLVFFPVCLCVWA